MLYATPPSSKYTNMATHPIRFNPLEHYWYLATPYTKYEDGIEYAAVGAAIIAERYILEGIPVYSPIVHCHSIAMQGSIDALDSAYWVAQQAPMMYNAYGLIVSNMKGWKESAGVCAEIEYFEQALKPIIYERGTYGMAPKVKEYL